MDPNNPVVKLCGEGMQAEAEGRLEDARDLFLRAWSASADDYDACVAAHFVARHQATPADTLRWNMESLARAEEVGDERVQSFYPSLYLNIGHSHEQLGNLAEASRYYEMASGLASILSDDRYGDIVRSGVENGRRRISEAR